MLETTLDVNYSIVGMLETTMNAKYSTVWMLESTKDFNYSTGGMLETTRVLITQYNKGMLKTTKNVDYSTRIIRILISCYAYSIPPVEYISFLVYYPASLGWSN